MNRIALICFVAVFSTATVLAQPAPSPQSTPAVTSSPAAKVTIEGLVRDLACPIQNPEAKATKFNLECALECARNGSPLVIQTQDGVLYFPISDSTPDKDQHEKLMPFVGKYVRVVGTVYERKGTRAIAMTEIKEMKNVHLTTDAK
jgi:DNA/RNA endonuclease YhcR with UshA esterase domain